MKKYKIYYYDTGDNLIEIDVETDDIHKYVRFMPTAIESFKKLEKICPVY